LALPIGWARGLSLKGAIALAVVGLALIIALFAYTHRSQSTSAAFTLGRAVPGWGSSKPLPFSFPAGVAVDSQGTMYVADEFNSTIQRLSPEGVPFAPLGTHGSAPGQFQLPSAVAVDRQGNIYVADTNNSRIQKLSPSGQPLDQWPVNGQPGALAVDRQGNIYVATPNGIEKLSPAGTHLADWPNLGLAMAVDDHGDIYADGKNGSIVKVSPRGKKATLPGKIGLPNTFAQISGLVVDSRGDIYVVDLGNYRIQRFSPAGTLLTQWGSKGSAIGHFEGLSALALDDQGNVYAADAGNGRIQKFSPGGQPLAHWGPNSPPCN
jgi:DNA-binding beta-propeller fold protein YncE